MSVGIPHITVMVSLSTLAVRPVGAVGARPGVAVASASAPSPMLFTARTWNPYSVPLVRPVIREAPGVSGTADGRPNRCRSRQPQRSGTRNG